MVPDRSDFSGMRGPDSEFRRSKEQTAEFVRIFQPDSVDQSAKLQFLAAYDQRQTDAVEKTVEFGVAGAETLSQFTVQQLRHRVRAQQFVDALMRDEVAAFRVLVGH